VAEGVETTRSVVAVAARLHVEVPISREVHAVLYEGKSPRKTVEDLMPRETRDEDG
jgi:glycerol-3-phosphate dehydrogenase (NAD(P)+)